jgi:flagellar FliL protein
MPEEKTTPTVPQGKIPNNNVLLIGLFSFMITVIFFGTFIIVTLRQSSNPKPHVETARNEEIGPLVSLGEEIIVNINSERGFEHYLKIQLTLEVDSEKTQVEVSKRIPQIRDLTISILSSKTKEKISEKEGKDLVRSEIINSINKNLTIGRVRRVFFEDFVIQ